MYEINIIFHSFFIYNLKNKFIQQKQEYQKYMYLLSKLNKLHNSIKITITLNISINVNNKTKNKQNNILNQLICCELEFRYNEPHFIEFFSLANYIWITKTIPLFCFIVKPFLLMNFPV